MSIEGYSQRELKLKTEFKIDEYISLREEFPDRVPDLLSVASMSKERIYSANKAPILLQEELNKFGLDFNCFVGVLDGSEKAIDHFCMNCIKAIANREKLKKKKAGVVGLGEAISDRLLNYLIGVITEIIFVKKIMIPDSFHILIKLRINFFKNKTLTDMTLIERKIFVAKFMRENPDYSVRKIGKMCGVTDVAIQNWLAEGKEVEPLLNRCFVVKNYGITISLDLEE